METSTLNQRLDIKEMNNMEPSHKERGGKAGLPVRGVFLLGEKVRKNEPVTFETGYLERA